MAWEPGLEFWLWVVVVCSVWDLIAYGWCVVMTCWLGFLRGWYNILVWHRGGVGAFGGCCWWVWVGLGNLGGWIGIEVWVCRLVLVTDLDSCGVGAVYWFGFGVV